MMPLTPVTGPGYVNAQGGPFVRREDLQVRTPYEPRTEFNQYGEETARIRGVYDSAIARHRILTRQTAVPLRR